MLAGGGQLGGRRVEPSGRPAYRYANDAGKDLEARLRRSGMIPQNFEYATPSSMKEALALLSGGDAKILAGGMSLIPMMKLRLAAPERLVDLSRVPGLTGITEEAGAIHIGAMTTHHEVEESAILRARCPLLAEAAANIGHVQVR